MDERHGELPSENIDEGAMCNMADGGTNLQVYVASVGLLMRITHD